ncbi:hypothetical protein D7Z54_26360 [Salibacterium salarium]|uniref:Uncharacterized protein n=1 Tax=Salibacterium salarium TaxID=284579 RepID=A0A428MW57_9BACI|nr:hypothetical protein D7Z54_26360 [Salibacterium salarium]
MAKILLSVCLFLLYYIQNLSFSHQQMQEKEDINTQEKASPYHETFSKRGVRLSKERDILYWSGKYAPN